jgi:hypothetical protein
VGTYHELVHVCFRRDPEDICQFRADKERALAIREIAETFHIFQEVLSGLALNLDWYEGVPIQGLRVAVLLWFFKLHVVQGGLFPYLVVLVRFVRLQYYALCQKLRIC